ncbi:helix-turn-helix domain-containing protein [Paenibacillus cremeus]|nr:helix-turn-helix domain-containing protein [Paenibacillus cremeus]
MRFPKFLFKLIVFSLFLSIFPVLTLGLFSYIKLTSSVQETIYKANEQILLQNQMRVEQMLKTIERSVVQFSSSPLVGDSLGQALTFRQFDVVNQLSKELKRLQTIDLPISDISLVNFEKGWLINNNGLRSLEPQESQSFREIKQNTSWSLDPDELNSNPSSGGVRFLKKTPTDFAEHYEFIIVRIPFSDLSRLIKTDKLLGDYLILDQRNRVLLDNRNAALGADLSGTPLSTQLAELPGDSGYLTMHTKSGDEAVLVRKSDYNGWTYVSKTPVATILSGSKEIGWITLWTCVGIFMVTLLISIFISRRMYTPILQLYQSAVHSNKELKPGHWKDEFQILSSRFSSLLDGQTELLRRSERQLPQLKDLFVLQLYEGKVRAEEIQPTSVMYGFAGPWKHMCVMAVDIDELKETRYTQRDVDLLLFAIHNIAYEVIPHSKLYHAMVVHKSVVLLLGGDHPAKEHFTEEIYVFASLLQSQVEQFLGLKVSIGLSRVFPELSGASTAFDESMEALQYKFRAGTGTILWIEEVRPERHSHLFIPDQAVKSLMDALKLADEKAATQALLDCLQSLAEHNISYKQYQVLLAGLLNDLIKEVLKTGESFPALQDEKASVFDQFFELKTRQDTEQWFLHAILRPMVRIMSRRRDLQNKKISEHMIDIVQLDYDKDLTLESCAARLNYHPNYIKRVFRHDTGINFSDYLLQYRIQKAKEWLLETDMTITEIADRLKYSNLQNFSRSFRRVVGSSPSEFKDRYEADRPPDHFKVP